MRGQLEETRREGPKKKVKEERKEEGDKER